MNFRRSCLCIPLLAFLAAGGAAPVAADEVVLILPPSPASAFQIWIPYLAEEICTEPKRAIVECPVIVKDPPEHLAPIQEKGAVELAGGNVVTTPCGVWDAEPTLDPARLQPASTVFFQEVPEDPGYGVFAVILEHRPNLHLVNRETGQTADFALRPMPGLSGSWTLTSTESLAPIRQRVITFENCIPGWIFENSGYEVIPKAGCEPCPEPRPDTP